jgi:hypothetical protein
MPTNKSHPVPAFTYAGAASGNSFSSNGDRKRHGFRLSRFVVSSVKRIHEPFRLLLDVHLIVTLNDLSLFHLLDKHRFVGQLYMHKGAYFFAYEK